MDEFRRQDSGIIGVGLRINNRSLRFGGGFWAEISAVSWAILLILGTTLHAALPSLGVKVTVTVEPESWSLFSMGRNEHGQLGDGSTAGRNIPYRIFDDVVDAAAGREHTLIVRSDGSMWGMGWNEEGQLGLGDRENRKQPVRIAEGVVSVAAGYSHSLFVKDDGTLWGMGSNTFGELGANPLGVSILVPVKLEDGVKQAAAGEFLSLYVREEATLWGMGRNTYGGIGDGTNTNRSESVFVAANVDSVTVGRAHSLFLKTDSTLWGMGPNWDGLLGDGTTRQHRSPIQIANDVVQVSAGAAHSLFVDREGRLFGMGNNDKGQLGIGNQKDQLSPVLIAENVDEISAGFSHSLFLRGDRTLWGMGSNEEGQLGLPFVEEVRESPVQVARDVRLVTQGHARHALFGGENRIVQVVPAVAAVSAGQRVSFRAEIEGINALGYQWYEGRSGETRFPIAGATTSEFTTEPISKDTFFWVMVRDAMENYESSEALVRLRTKPILDSFPPVAYVDPGESARLEVRVLGDDLMYEWYRVDPKGDRELVFRSTEPFYRTLPVGESVTYRVRVANELGAVETGDIMVIVRPRPLAGDLRGFGGNYSGELWGRLGVANPNPQLISQDVTQFGAFGASGKALFFVRNNGELWVTGGRGSMEFGLGHSLISALGEKVADGVSRVSVGENHMLYIDVEGRLWGIRGRHDVGQIGIENFEVGRGPALIAEDVAQVSCGLNFSMMIRPDGTLWSFGVNELGQLGVGSSTNERVPKRVAEDVIAVSAGRGHALFVKQDSSLWGMGDGTSGALSSIGMGAHLDRPEKIRDQVMAIAAGDGYTLFTDTNHTLWGVGRMEQILSYYQLVVGPDTQLHFAQPRRIAENVREFAAGKHHILYVTRDGTLHTIGLNRDGQLGDGTRNFRNSPAEVQGGVSLVEAGEVSSYFLTQEAPYIVRQPEFLALQPGACASLTAVADGSPDLSYQWYAGESGNTGNPIRGATHSVLPVCGQNSPANYWVRVSNAVGAVDSDSVTVAVLAIPRILSQTPDADLTVGGSVSFSIESQGVALSFQWYKGQRGDISNPLPGTNSPTYTTPSLFQDQRYWVRVVNAIGSADSQTFTARILPTIESQPNGVSVKAGEPFTLSVKALGPDLQYRWFRDDVLIVGATEPVLHQARAQLSLAGKYFVVVGNSAGSVTSERVLVEVRNVVGGIVFDLSTGRPLPGVSVSSGAFVTASDNQGRWEFSGEPGRGRALPAGVHSIRFVKAGFGEQTRMVVVPSSEGSFMEVGMSIPGFLNINTFSLPAAEVDVDYREIIHVEGGQGRLQFAVEGDGFPGGLILDRSLGVIEGKPQSAGAFEFTIVVRDDAGAEAGIDYTLEITRALELATEAVLARGTLGKPYFESLSTEGGTLPVTYEFVAGRLPPGLQISSGGAIGGFNGLLENFDGPTLQTTDWEVSGAVVPAITVNQRLRFGAVADGQESWLRRDVSVQSTARVVFDFEVSSESGRDFLQFFVDGRKEGEWSGEKSGTFRMPTSLTAGEHRLEWVYVKDRLLSEGSDTGWIDNLSVGRVSTPEALGPFEFTVEVRDASFRTARKNFIIEVDPPLEIRETQVFDGIVGRPYNFSFQVTGGYGRYEWDLFFGQLPEGLSISATSGELTGIPGEASHGTLVLSVRDEVGRQSFRDFSLFVSEPLRVVTDELPLGLTGGRYSERIFLEGGKPPYSFSLESSLPPGLGLDLDEGVIEGVPQISILRNFGIVVSDSTFPTKQSDSQTLRLRTREGLTITSTAVIPSAQHGTSITPRIMQAGGGTGPYSWEIYSGALPSGLRLDRESGEITGTPVDAGEFVFEVEVVDANGTRSQKQFYWTVRGGLQILTGALPDAATATEYTFRLESAGGAAPYRWRILSGSLPFGLVFNEATGLISGVPTVPQTQRAFTVEVNDSDVPAQTVQKTLFLGVQDDLYIRTHSFPSGRINNFYSAGLDSEFGAPPFTWRLVSGAIPGLELENLGERAALKGIPVRSGEYNVVVELSDSGIPRRVAQKEFRVRIHDRFSFFKEQLQSGVRGLPYSESILIDGGVVPLRYSVSEGGLPVGIALNSSTGHLSGIPQLTRGQSATFTIRVEDSGIPLEAIEKEYTIGISDGIAIAVSDLHRGLQGNPYRFQLSAIGGISPHRWELLSGTLPTGMTLDSASGVLSGVPDAFGSYGLVVGVSDSQNPPVTDTQALLLEILPVDRQPPATPARLSIKSLSASSIEIRREGGGVLQRAARLDGPWVDLAGTGSPAVELLKGAEHFYRVVNP